MDPDLARDQQLIRTCSRYLREDDYIGGYVFWP